MKTLHPRPASAKPIRVLVISEAANPKLTSASLVGWSCAMALREVCDAHIVTELRNRDAFVENGLVEGTDFTAINARASQGTAWWMAKILRGGRLDVGWTMHSAAAILSYPFFERALWKQFKGALKRGEYDLVHRVTPLSPMTSSWLAKKLKQIGVAFILGPLNGGVPWPEPFKHLQIAEGERLGKLRGLAKWLPGYQATRQNSSVIIAGARSILKELKEVYHPKTVFIPENAIDVRKFPPTAKALSNDGVLRIAFVGRLVPLKGVDMLIEAAAPLAREGRVQVDIIGDGPERAKLADMIKAESLENHVKLEGWVPHAELAKRLQQSDVFAFPSVREFGGGAVLEAMALGLVPVVLDHGGPVELVPKECGYSLAMEDRSLIVAKMRDLLASLIEDRSPLADKSRNSQAHVRQHFTWEAKARQLLEVYEWALGRRTTKPGWGVPFEFSAMTEIHEECSVRSAQSASSVIHAALSTEH